MFAVHFCSTNYSQQFCQRTQFFIYKDVDSWHHWNSMRDCTSLIKHNWLYLKIEKNISLVKFQVLMVISKKAVSWDVSLSWWGRKMLNNISQMYQTTECNVPGDSHLTIALVKLKTWTTQCNSNGSLTVSNGRNNVYSAFIQTTVILTRQFYRWGLTTSYLYLHPMAL